MDESSSKTISTNFFINSTTEPVFPSTDFFVSRTTPGNVGVCLSGGGSRSFAAGIGQLQALEALQVNNQSLLSQTRAIATVSGGGWIGIPFTYLPSTWTDTDFLGTYTSPANLTYDMLNALPPAGIANQITEGFTIADLATQALLLYNVYKVPSTMLWQVLMGETFLKPYQLGVEYLPNSLFSYNAASLATYVTGPNPNPPISREIAHLVASGRPYLLSMLSLSVNIDGVDPDMLAPVQSTPFVTGVLAVPPGAEDANGRQVGGGGVSSFAFNSDPVSQSDGLITAMQGRQWSLTDVVGTSSAAFAQDLISQFQSWQQSPSRFAAALRVHGPRAVKKLARTPDEASRLSAAIDPALSALRFGNPPGPDLRASLDELANPTAIVPAYQYWSVDNPPFEYTVNTTQFADGGSLENSGIAGMLSNSDIGSVIAFLNVQTPLSQDSNGNIVVDQCIPPLFGYQPYNNGYQTYASTSTPDYPVFQYNQIFESVDFQALLTGLWNASNANGPARAAAIYTQTLTTVANTWFNVPGGTSVTIVWVYLNYASDWYYALSDKGIIDNIRTSVDYEQTVNYFPNYHTLKTELSAFQINILSNFASWVVQDEANSAAFTSLYTSSQG